MSRTIINYKNTKWTNLNLLYDIKKLASLFAGEVPVRFSRIGNSNINRLFRVDFKHKSVILKISPNWYNTSLYREKWCYERIKKLVNVPKVLFYLNSNNKLLPSHEILALEFINGRQLTKRNFLDNSINEGVASIFRAVHSLDTKKYGFLDANMQGKHTTWTDFLLDIENIDTPLCSKHVAKSDLKWLLDSMSSIETNGHHCLLYGDFKEDNFISKDNSIFAIDFQNCLSGIDLYDISIGVFNIRFLLKHLRTYVNVVSPNITHEVLLYSMRHAVTVILNSAASGDVKTLNFSKKRLKELKRAYSKIT